MHGKDKKYTYHFGQNLKGGNQLTELGHKNSTQKRSKHANCFFPCKRLDHVSRNCKIRSIHIIILRFKLRYLDLRTIHYHSKNSCINHSEA